MGEGDQGGPALLLPLSPRSTPAPAAPGSPPWCGSPGPGSPAPAPSPAASCPSPPRRAPARWPPPCRGGHRQSGRCQPCLWLVPRCFGHSEGLWGWQQPPYLSRHCAARQAVLRAALTWLSQRQLSSRLSQRSMLSEASLQASTSLMKLSCSGRPLGGRENGVRGLAGLVLGGWVGCAGCRMARSP